MKTNSIQTDIALHRSLLSLILVLVGVCITSGCVWSRTQSPSGSFSSFDVSPEIVCINQGLPIVSISFRAKSSNRQCVQLKVNGVEITGNREVFREAVNVCGEGEWGETYRFSLASLYNNNIPPEIRVRIELYERSGQSWPPPPEAWDPSGILAKAEKTIITKNCPPPGLNP